MSGFRTLRRAPVEPAALSGGCPAVAHTRLAQQSVCGGGATVCRRVEVARRDRQPAAGTGRPPVRVPAHPGRPAGRRPRVWLLTNRKRSPSSCAVRTRFHPRGVGTGPTGGGHNDARCVVATRCVHDPELRNVSAREHDVTVGQTNVNKPGRASHHRRFASNRSPRLDGGTRPRSPSSLSTIAMWSAATSVACGGVARHLGFETAKPLAAIRSRGRRDVG